MVYTECAPRRQFYSPRSLLIMNALRPQRPYGLLGTRFTPLLPAFYLMCLHRDDVLIHRSVHSLFNVCTKSDVLISRSAFPLSGQCVRTDTNVLIHRSAHSLFSVCTETDVLIHRSSHSLFNVCIETGVLIYRSVCPLSVQCMHSRDGCVNSQVWMPALFQCVHKDIRVC